MVFAMVCLGFFCSTCVSLCVLLPSISLCSEEIMDFLISPSIVSATSISHLCIHNAHHDLSPPLRLDELVQEVISRNPNLQAAQQRIQAAELAALRAEVFSDPMVTIMSDQNQFRTPSNFMPMMKYELAQLFPFPGKLHLKGKIAEQTVALKRSEEITTLRELILRTKKLYFELYFNQVARQINAKNQEIVSNIISDAMALYKAGTAGFEEVLKAQTEKQGLNEQLVMLEAEHESIKAMLRAVLNQPSTYPLGDAEEQWSSEYPFNYMTLENIALDNRSELQGMQAMVDEQRLMAELAEREFFPDVTVSVGYERMNNRFMGRTDSAWTASISFNVPIWIEQRQLREVHEAERLAQANSDALEGMKAMIKSDIRQITAKIQSAQERIAIYESGLLSKTEETLAAATSKYRADIGNFFILLDTQRQLKSIELGYMQAKVEKEILLAELERAVGMDLKEISCAAAE